MAGDKGVWQARTVTCDSLGDVEALVWLVFSLWSVNTHGPCGISKCVCGSFKEDMNPHLEAHLENRPMGCTDGLLDPKGHRFLLSGRSFPGRQFGVAVSLCGHQETPFRAS